MISLRKSEEKYTQIPHLDRVDYFLSIIAVVFGLFVFIPTTAPALLMGDCAEFQTLSYTLGMTHPTGYPVYVLLGKLFTFLPFGEVSYRVNLMSAVFGAVTLGVLYLICRLLGSNRVSSLLGPMLLGICSVYWYLAVVAEVYTVSAGFISCFLLFLLLWRQKDSLPYLIAAGIVGGLSFGVHTSLLLLMPVFILYLFITGRKLNVCLGAIGGVLTGILLTLLAMWVLDTIDPPSSYYNSVVRPSLSLWGLNENNFDGFFERYLFLITARQFRANLFSNPLEMMPSLSLIYFGYMWKFFNPVTITLMGLGFSVMIIRWKPENLLIVLALPVLWIFIFNYYVSDIFVFYIPSYLLLAIAFSYGLTAAFDGYKWLLIRFAVRPNWVTVILKSTNIMVFLIFFTSIALQANKSIAAKHIVFVPEEFADFPYPVSNPERPRELARHIVNSLEDNAIVFTDWYMLYAYYYVAHVEQGRTGILFHETFAQDGITKLPSSLLKYINDRLGKQPVYITNPPDELGNIYDLRPVCTHFFLYSISRYKEEGDQVSTATTELSVAPISKCR